MQRRPSAPLAFRPIAFAILTFYAAALFLAALPEPVRPGFLAVPSELTDAVLRRFLVRGGISVFRPPRERIRHVLLNDCIQVRGIAPDGSVSWLQPAGGRCVTSGLRPGIPDVEWMIRSVLVGGEGFQIEAMREAVIGDFFCFAPPWRAHPLSAVELLWTKPGFDIDSGEKSTEAALLFRWRCDPPGLISEAAPPDEAQVRAFAEGGS